MTPHDPRPWMERMRVGRFLAEWAVLFVAFALAYITIRVFNINSTPVIMVIGYIAGDLGRLAGERWLP